MSIIKTPAVVLKTDNYRETSKIVTLYTESHGKLRTIAKGVRNSKSRWGGVLQSIAYIEAIIYFKENRTLHLLSSADYIDTFTNIYSNNKKIELAYSMIELANKATMENHESKALFYLIVEALQKLNDATKNYVNLLFNYEFKLAKILGFEVDRNIIKRLTTSFINKSIDSKSPNLYNYRPEDPKDTKSGDYKVNDKGMVSEEPGKALFDILRNGNFEEVTSFNILKPSMAVLVDFFEKYFEDYFDNVNFSKTKRVFNSKEMKI